MVMFDIAEGIPQGKALDIAAVLAGRRLRRPLFRREHLRGDRGRRGLHRHRRRAAQAGHEPRRSPQHQSQGDGAGRRRHQEIRAERLRDLHHQSARRHGVGAAEVLRPAQAEGGRHGGRARLLALPLFPRRRVQRLGRGRHRLRARRPRRHHGAAGALLDGRRHSAARPRQDGLDHAGAHRRDRRAHPRRRRRDRQPAQDRLGLLRAGGLRDRDGGELSQGQEARAAVRRLSQRRIRREGPLCRRAGRDRRQGRRAHRRDRAQRRREGDVRQVGRRGARPGRRLQEDRAGPRRSKLPPRRRGRRQTRERSHEHPRIPGEGGAARLRRAGAARRARPSRSRTR